jgi:hypothetical protein
MALTQVNRGTTPNDNSADTLYVAFGKVNSNATSLDTTITTSADSTFNNVKVGKGAGNIADNTSVGSVSLIANTTGEHNTGIGYGSLSANQGGTSNTAVGAYALQLNVSGAGNTSVGAFSSEKSLGGNNTAIGTASLYSNTTGNNNTAIGNSAYFNGNFNNTTSIGYNAQPNASNQVVIGDSNVTSTILKGTVSVASLTSTLDSTFNNIKVGKGGGNVNGNTTVGEGSLASNAAGQYNTALGYASLNKNQGGSGNTSIGVNALLENVSGANNTSVGYLALQNSIGSNNTCVGTASLYNTTGSQNTVIGGNAGNAQTIASNTTCVGYGSEVSTSNQVQLGNASTTTFVYGTVQNRSDLRDKTEVRDTVLGLDFINELRPVDYKWDMREDYKSEMPIKPELPAQELPIKELPIQEPLPLQGELSDLDYIKIVNQCNADYYEILQQYNLDYQVLLDQSNADYKELVDQNDADFQIVMDAWLESVKLDNITHDGTHIRNRYHHGLIAQEVKDVIQTSGVDFGGFQDHSVSGGQDVLSIGYDELIAPMIKAIQELTARINVLENN